ncbi:hypothetical protein AB205_0157420 [Aquarana catesbeiana]|uniref:Uncharacterized protein n=1 Tax=Aquarana catesbeiana TaxID=8400 RepID=A0A2G9RQZ0_AQUCT|nr:hypothetical protein AB205_0157420 [Aquarana catesbeiana]
MPFAASVVYPQPNPSSQQMGKYTAIFSNNIISGQLILPYPSHLNDDVLSVLGHV